MASRGVNKVILVGNIGQDPETRFFPDGGAITNASLATSETWKDRQTGEQKESTEWHKLVFRDMGNRKLGQWAGEWFHKGDKIYVEGKLRTRKWQSQDGRDHYTTEVIVSDMQSLTPRQQPAQGQGYQQQAYQQPAPAPQAAPQQPPPPPQGQPQGAHQHQPQGAPQAPQGDFGTFDDDIPF